MTSDKDEIKDMVLCEYPKLMTEDQFEIDLAILTTNIRHCMDEMGRFSDAASKAGKQRYNEAEHEMKCWQEELDKLLKEYHGDE